MAEDWAADVRKYVADADDRVIAAIVRYCGIALQKRDSSLVSFTDPVETGRVRENFLKKKLGLTHADEELDGAIAAVGERMKGANFKNRVTVYYLLLDHFGLLHLFGGAPAAASGGGGAAALGGAAAVGLAGLAGAGAGAAEPDPTPPPPPPPVAAVPLAAVPPPPSDTPRAAYAVPGPGDEERRGGGFGWWPWLLLALLVLALLWWLFLRQPSGPDAGPVAAPVNDTAVFDNGTGNAGATGDAVDLATAPAEGTVAIPTGAGVTVETRDGKPVAKVYFDTGAAQVVPAFAATASGLKAWLDGHEGATLAVSGFNDPTGNAAANAELSKNRAQAVKAALVAAGIADGAVELVKPEATTDTTTSDANARRVEVVVR